MPKKSNSAELLSKLGEAMKPQAAPVKPAVADRGAGRLNAAEKKPPSPARAEKITATIYPLDWQRLDEIKDFFRARGFRNLSDSEAVRLACRAVRIDDALVHVYQEMKGEDGRQRTKSA